MNGGEADGGEDNQESRQAHQVGELGGAVQGRVDRAGGGHHRGDRDQREAGLAEERPGAGGQRVVAFGGDGVRRQVPTATKATSTYRAMTPPIAKRTSQVTVPTRTPDPPACTLARSAD
jgi:hypothetical protein